MNRKRQGTVSGLFLFMVYEMRSEKALQKN